MPEQSPQTPGTVDPDLVVEARRILEEMERQGLEVRLLGGIAIRLALGDRFDSRLERPHNDIDFITLKKHGSDVEAALERLGWEPERQFNAINGARRLLFTDPATGHKIDGFVEHFEMCHTLPLTESFPDSREALPPADLLMTKAQIIELNAKDRGDCYALLIGCTVSDGPGAHQIDASRIARLASRDWGLHHTLSLNFEKLRSGLGEMDFSDAEKLTIEGSLDAITERMAEEPKTRSWKLRDRIGERKRWYDEPEEID
jgi:hypothetical protein